MSDATTSRRTPTVLAQIVQATREELVRRKRERPPAELEALVQDAAVDEIAAARASGAFRDALSTGGISVIAEFKRRSPSAGALREGARPDELARAYERGGASALSVLTEGPSFGGSLDDLRAARGATGLPILRKDFVVDRYQLLEARLAGADAALLIVAALADSELAALYDEARALGLDVLVEVHDAGELDRALALEPEIVGINNRDLRDFSVDVARTRALRQAIPDGVVVVSESGIRSTEQLRRLEREGVDAVLVGESLMRAPDPAQALDALLDLDQR